MSLNNFGVVYVKNKTILSRSGQPDDEGMSTLNNIGIKEVLKLNSSKEYPLKREQSSVFLMVKEVALDAFKPDEFLVRSLAELINKYLDCDKSVHVHCSHGRDRTGLVIGAWQLLYGGYSYEQVMNSRKCYGTNWVIDIPDHEIIEMLQKFAKEKSA